MMKRVEVPSSMAVSQMIPVERVKPTHVVLMSVLMRFPMLFSVNGTLQTQVREQIQVVLLTRKQKTSPTEGASAVRIRLPSVRQQKQKISPTAGASAMRIRLPSVRLQNQKTSPTHGASAVRISNYRTDAPQYRSLPASTGSENTPHR
jgi:hypothetical protein